MASIGRPRISATLLRLDNPVGSLTIAFWLWKVLVFITIVACPAPGYDTSTTLVPYVETSAVFDSDAKSLSWPLSFARWDAIYFLHIAEKGYVFEQEWAFSYPRLLGSLMSAIRWTGGSGGPVNTALVGVVLSHITHYLSVLSLYGLSANIFGYATVMQRLFCLLSAALHIICPAGPFLSAPYGESIFSFLNFTGFYLYSSSLISERNGDTGLRDLKIMLSAILFACATIVRSNGILSGFLFAYDAGSLAWTSLIRGPSVHLARRLAVILFGGSIVAVGMIMPQIWAYQMYCLAGADVRPWCNWTIPSIYSWVQSYYW